MIRPVQASAHCRLELGSVLFQNTFCKNINFFSISFFITKISINGVGVGRGGGVCNKERWRTGKSEKLGGFLPKKVCL